MNKEIRLISFLSPKIEIDFYNYHINDNVIELLKDTYFLYEQLKHLVVLIIPNELLSIFNSNKKLRLFKDLIENNSQSNILFASNKQITDCNNSNLSSLFSPFPESSLTNSLIINSLYRKKYPFLIDTTSIIVIKKSCNECDGQNICSNYFEIQTSFLPKINYFKKYLTEIAQKNLELWTINKNAINSNDLKALGFLIAIFHNIPSEPIVKIKECLILEELCEDLKSVQDIQSINNIAFSIFRAHVFPSATDPNSERNHYSIDWHRNNPFHFSHFNLYRIDVVTPVQTGIKNSGTNRLLMAEKDNKKYFIAYTNNHDFSNIMIKTRIDALNAIIDV